MKRVYRMDTSRLRRPAKGDRLLIAADRREAHASRWNSRAQGRSSNGRRCGWLDNAQVALPIRVSGVWSHGAIDRGRTASTSRRFRDVCVPWDRNAQKQLVRGGTPTAQRGLRYPHHPRYGGFAERQATKHRPARSSAPVRPVSKQLELETGPRPSRRLAPSEGRSAEQARGFHFCRSLAFQPGESLCPNGSRAHWGLARSWSTKRCASQSSHCSLSVGESRIPRWRGNHSRRQRLHQSQAEARGTRDPAPWRLAGGTV